MHILSSYETRENSLKKIKAASKESKFQHVDKWIILTLKSFF